MKIEQQQVAKDLYFQADKTQQEIADILDVNRRTVYLWVKNGKWEEMKQAARQAPGMIIQDIYNHIEAINSKIRNREDHCPTMPEVEMLRKLINMTKVIPKNHSGAYTETFSELVSYINTKDSDDALKTLKYANEYVRGTLYKKPFSGISKNNEIMRQTIANLEKMEEGEPVIRSDSEEPQEAQPLTNTSSPSERSGEVNEIFSPAPLIAVKTPPKTTKPATAKPPVILSPAEGLAGEQTKYPISNTPSNGIISVYVNPANTILNITSTGKINSVKIYDRSDKTMYTDVSLNTTSLKVNIAAFPKGDYIAKINGITVREFIKR